jgi:hypothetical protein
MVVTKDTIKKWFDASTKIPKEWKDSAKGHYILEQWEDRDSEGKLRGTFRIVVQIDELYEAAKKDIFENDTQFPTEASKLAELKRRGYDKYLD